MLKRWTKLVHGLRIRQRMREQYGTAPTADIASSSKDADQDERSGGGGGFLTRAGDVVQPYSLPRAVHVVFTSPPRSPAPDDRTPTPVPEPALPDANERLGDSDSDSEVLSDHRTMDTLAIPGENRGMPKSMAELAAEAEATAMAQMSTGGQRKGREEAHAEEEEEDDAASVTPSRRRAPPRARPKITNGEARAVRPRGRKRARAHESDGEDEDGEDWRSDDGGVEEDTAGEDGRTRNAKRARTRTRTGPRDRSTVPVHVPTSDRVLRVRKK